MKLGQNICLDEISDEFESGSCLVKYLVTSSNLRNTSSSLKVQIAANYKGVCLQIRSKPHSYNLKIW